MLTLLSIIADHYLSNQPKIDSFDHLAKKPPREKERKERKGKKKRKTKEKPKRKRKGKERKREGASRQQGRRRERVHGIKRKERKSPTSHHEPP